MLPLKCWIIPLRFDPVATGRQNHARKQPVQKIQQKGTCGRHPAVIKGSAVCHRFAGPTSMAGWTRWSGLDRIPGPIFFHSGLKRVTVWTCWAKYLIILSIFCSSYQLVQWFSCGKNTLNNRVCGGWGFTGRFVHLGTFPLIPVQICPKDPCGHSVLM